MYLWTNHFGGIWNRKKITKAELINTRFSKLFAHFGIEKDGVYLAERYQFYLAQQGQVFSGAMEFLDSLIDRGYELYAVTNGITTIQTGRLAQSGLAPYFNQVFISEQLQNAKTWCTILWKNLSKDCWI